MGDPQSDVTRRVDEHVAPRDPLAGTPYKRISQLGEGGMGEVLLAEHRELGTLYVVKLLRADVAPDPKTVERMRVEAQSGARIEHPNLARVFHFATNEAGRPYIVMEYLEGRALDEVVAEHGKLPTGEALRIARDVLAALAAVHRVGVVHRDIKPANVFLCSDGRIKLLDLGLAKVVEIATAATPSPSAHPTDTGVVVGTPRYMAPEQSSSVPVTARTDLYAVGLLLYRMLAGRGPFDDAKTFEEITRAHLLRTPAPPSSYLDSALPAGLDDIILRCLEKDPVSRHPTAEALSGALDVVARALPPEEPFAARGVDRAAPYLGDAQPRVDRVRPPASQRYRVGDKIDGRWEILGELGAGGVGLVYAVEHAFTRKPGALKALRGEGPNAEVLASKMHDEAMLLSQTPHPNLVEVYDAGRDARGVWMVMERLVGRELRQVIDDEGALAVPRALRYAEAIAGAVAAVSDLGVIHRDLKPSNVHVSQKDVVKVIDFGMARFRKGATVEGQIVGTLPYMSPEHLRDEPLDSRADVFALGVMLHEMLSGRHPFRDAQTDDGWPPGQELMARMLHDELPSIEGRVGSDVWRLVARATVKNRDKRFVNMATFAAEIQRVSADLSGGQGYLPTQRLPEGEVPQIAPTVAMTHLEQAHMVKRDAERQRVAALPASPPAQLQPLPPTRTALVAERRRMPAGVVVAMVAAIVLLVAAAFVLVLG